MATFGQIRFEIAKLYPGIDPDVLDGFIRDGYQACLDQLSWDRTQVESTLPVYEEYATGTVAVVQGSASITGTGTTWTSAMSGRMIRFSGADSYYGFTYVSATTGTLDRIYEGEDDTEASYRINHNVIQLPADCRGVMQLHYNAQNLTKVEKERLPVSRNYYGDPTEYVMYMDSATNPPNMQVELFPIPQNPLGLILTYTAEYGVTSIDSSVSILPWMRPGAIKAYAQIEICKMPAFKDLAAVAEHRLAFQERLTELRRLEAERVGPTQLHMADRFTSHRNRRA